MRTPIKDRTRVVISVVFLVVLGLAWAYYSTFSYEGIWRWVGWALAPLHFLLVWVVVRRWRRQRER